MDCAPDFGVDYKVRRMSDLWKSKDPATWEAILDRYYDIVANIGKNRLLELEMCALLHVLNYNSNVIAVTAFRHYFLLIICHLPTTRA